MFALERELISVARINVTFIDKEGDEHNFQVAQGDNLLDIAQSEDLEMEGGQIRARPAISIQLMSTCRSVWWILCLFNVPRHR